MFAIRFVDGERLCVFLAQRFAIDGTLPLFAVAQSKMPFLLLTARQVICRSGSSDFIRDASRMPTFVPKSPQHFKQRNLEVSNDGLQVKIDAAKDFSASVHLDESLGIDECTSE